MKIETSIKPRKDGGVVVKVDDIKYEFKADESGVLVAEVENEAHISFLLNRSDDFMPADEADFAAAAALIAAADEDGDDEVDEDETEPVDLNAAPIEEPASVVAGNSPVRAAKLKKK